MIAAPPGPKRVATPLSEVPPAHPDNNPTKASATMSTTADPVPRTSTPIVEVAVIVSLLVFVSVVVAKLVVLVVFVATVRYTVVS